MRQIQRQSREREAESTKPVKALWKSEKYKDVTSRIKSDITVIIKTELNTPPATELYS